MGAIGDMFEHGQPSYMFRFFSERLNKEFCRIYGLENLEIPLEDHKDQSQLKDSNHAVTVWLTNLTRLYLEFIRYEHAPNFSFVDVGHGNGVATLFAAKCFNFQSFQGIEIDKRLNDCVLRNLTKISPFLQRNTPPVFIEADLIDYKLKFQKHFLFLFNPFGWGTMETFLSNNSDIIEQQGVYFGLANDYILKDIMSPHHCELLWRNRKTNCSLVKFDIR